MGYNRIKGITIEIGGDTTKLQTALKGVNTQIRASRAQLKDVDYFDTVTAAMKSTRMYVDGFKSKLVKDTSYGGLLEVSFSVKEF